MVLTNVHYVSGTMYLAMEFVKNGDLRSYLRKQRKAKHNLYANTKIISPVQQTMLLKFAFDAASGLDHLAEKQVCAVILIPFLHMSCRVSIIQASVLQYNCLSAVFQLYS